MDWIIKNWGQVTVAVLAFDALLFAITKLTPTVKDDNIYAILHGWITKFFQPKQ
jgi:hypothetical protein